MHGTISSRTNSKNQMQSRNSVGRRDTSARVDLISSSRTMGQVRSSTAPERGRRVVAPDDEYYGSNDSRSAKQTNNIRK
eukprot:scaffold9933_cov226-Amphora_coffeaeformis.AAC.3